MNLRERTELEMALSQRDMLADELRKTEAIIQEMFPKPDGPEWEMFGRAIDWKHPTWWAHLNDEQATLLRAIVEADRD